MHLPHRECLSHSAPPLTPALSPWERELRSQRLLGRPLSHWERAGVRGYARCEDRRFPALAELEQHTVAAARIGPADVAGGLGQHAACPAFQAAVGSDFHLPLAVQAVATRRAEPRQRHQRRRRNVMRRDQNVRPARVHQVPVLIEFFLDPRMLLATPFFLLSPQNREVSIYTTRHHPSPCPSPPGRGVAFATVENGVPLPWGEGQGEGRDLCQCLHPKQQPPLAPRPRQFPRVACEPGYHPAILTNERTISASLLFLSLPSTRR